MLALARANARFVRHFDRHVKAYRGLVEAIPPDPEKHSSLCPVLADVVISEVTVIGAPACRLASPPDPFPVLEVGDNVFRNCTSAEWVELEILPSSRSAIDVAGSDFEPGTWILRFDAMAQPKVLRVKPRAEREGVEAVESALTWQFPGFPVGDDTGGGADMKIQDP